MLLLLYNRYKTIKSIFVFYTNNKYQNWFFKINKIYILTYLFLTFKNTDINHVFFFNMFIFSKNLYYNIRF